MVEIKIYLKTVIFLNTVCHSFHVFSELAVGTIIEIHWFELTGSPQAEIVATGADGKWVSQPLSHWTSYGKSGVEDAG